VSKYRRAAKVDANQSALVKELRDAGYSVATGHDDILVGRNGATLWVEVKASEKKKRQLKPSQVALLKDWRGAYLVAASFDEIHNWFNGRRHENDSGGDVGGDVRLAGGDDHPPGDRQRGAGGADLRADGELDCVGV